MNDSSQRFIIHVDVDAFYVSAERCRRPDLMGKPVAVSQGNSGGFVAVSHEARRCGVRKGDGIGAKGQKELAYFQNRPDALMPAVRKRCPALIVLPMDTDHYRAVSRRVRDELAAAPWARHRKPRVEQASIDDYFVDVTEEVHMRSRATACEVGALGGRLERSSAKLALASAPAQASVPTPVTAIASASASALTAAAAVPGEPVPAQANARVGRSALAGAMAWAQDDAEHDEDDVNDSSDSASDDSFQASFDAIASSNACTHSYGQDQDQDHDPEQGQGQGQGQMDGRGWSTAAHVAEELRAHIRSTFMPQGALTVSVGVARNKLLARLCSKQHGKADAQTLLPPSQVHALLARTPILGVPGYKHKLGRRLVDITGCERVGELAAMDAARLTRAVTQAGGTARQARRLLDACRGVDAEPVMPNAPPHSILVELSFPPTTDGATLTQTLQGLADKLLARVAADAREFGRLPATLVVGWRQGYGSLRTRRAPLPPGAARAFEARARARGGDASDAHDDKTTNYGCGHDTEAVAAAAAALLPRDHGPITRIALTCTAFAPSAACGGAMKASSGGIRRFLGNPTTVDNSSKKANVAASEGTGNVFRTRTGTGPSACDSTDGVARVDAHYAGAAINADIDATWRPEDAALRDAGFSADVFYALPPELRQEIASQHTQSVAAAPAQGSCTGKRKTRKRSRMSSIQSFFAPSAPAQQRPKST